MGIMKEVKNIITINDFNYSQGGASKVAIDTANMLVENGYNSIFVSAVSDREKSSLSENVVQYEFGGKEFLHYDNKIIGMLDGLKCRNFTKFVENVLDNYSTENTVVHIHGWTKACSSDFFQVLKKRGFRTFLTLHEYFSFCPNGAYFDYKKNTACNKKGCSLSCLLCNCDSRNYIFKLYRFIREIIYKKNMDFEYIYAIYISHFEKRVISKQIRIPNYKVIENPVFPIETLSSSKEFDFAYVGRTSKEKGIDLFTKLAKNFKDKKFLIIGDYHTDLANVVVTGWVSEQQVDTYIGKTKFLVFPSLWPETFGLNVIRALYAGIPCLVSSNTAAEDYVIEGINGFVFEQGNFQSILHYSEMMPLLNCVTAKNGNAEYMNSLIEIYETGLRGG